MFDGFPCKCVFAFSVFYVFFLWKMFISSLFLPVSLEHFLVSISSSFSQASPFPFCFSGTTGERPSLNSLKNRHGEDFCPSSLLETGTKSSVPVVEGRACAPTACFRTCTATGSQNTRVSSPSFTPRFTTGPCSFPWQAAHSVAADKQERRSIAWKASCAWALTAPRLVCALGSEGACVCTRQRSSSLVTGCGTQRDSCLMLCVLTTQGHKGSTVREDLSTWKNCPSGKLPFHPIFWSTTASSERTFPWKEAPMLVPDP